MKTAFLRHSPGNARPRPLFTNRLNLPSEIAKKTPACTGRHLL